MAGISVEDASKDEKWLLHVDGSSTIQVSGAGIVITSLTGEDLEFAVKFDFKASNNEAEYEALVIGMKMAHEGRARHLLAYSDSQLIVKQVEDTYKAKEENMIQISAANSGTKDWLQLFPTYSNTQGRKCQGRLPFQTCQYPRRLQDQAYHYTIPP
ncbi:UNVERIFIED_CONTAM: hypothetical protein Slati_1327500 [Sesamum latifolium]|uniref:RNase H type-1 domain-containing protein n=1 Tax=Sesamum latifolium TaxID=2727402 RepID=A0AAW2XK37_9LAMI